MYKQTIHIRSDNTIRPNMNTLFGQLFGTEANTKRIFGTSIIVVHLYISIGFMILLFPAAGLIVWNSMGSNLRYPNINIASFGRMQKGKSICGQQTTSSG